ncbi:MAG: GIY-YIG nuclease family protein [Desulfobacterales bacterium]|nr:GIY-YIG nuclease family protein [Desulfobacterales bacterium]
MPETWSVYLLKCCDNTLYCGVTKNIESRIIQHNRGRASKYTRSRLPVALAACRSDLSKQDAFRLEYRIKQIPASKKIPTLLETD